MQVKLDNEVILEIDQHMLDLLAYDLSNVNDEIKRRLHWVITHKADQCYERLEKEWLPKLRSNPNIVSIPKSRIDFVNLVKSQQDYKNREQRDLQERQN